MEAQAKLEAQNQAVQDKADADNLKANGAVTQAASVVGPDGRAQLVQQQQTNPDGTPAYQPADLGVKLGARTAHRVDVQRTQWEVAAVERSLQPGDGEPEAEPNGATDGDVAGEGRVGPAAKRT